MPLCRPLRFAVALLVACVISPQAAMLNGIAPRPMDKLHGAGFRETVRAAGTPPVFLLPLLSCYAGLAWKRNTSALRKSKFLTRLFFGYPQKRLAHANTGILYR